MVDPPDPAELARERAWLAEVRQRGRLGRWRAYLGRGGPGYLQSALTLGGGSAAASLFAGAAFGYELLWVAPLAMLLGVAVLTAVAHQTLSTGARPFVAMKTHAGPVFAYGWAIGALLASIVWHFAQYALASAVLVDLGEAAGLELSRGWMGVLILAWAIPTAQLYVGRSRVTRLFDRVLKVLVWAVVACFALVVIKTGVGEPRELARGLFGLRIPASEGDVDGLTVAIAGLAAAIVVNMVFLYPYTLLARGWGREHRELARFDLFAGMFVPYVLATGFMVIATANTIHADGGFSGTGLSPVDAAATFAELIGPTVGRVVFDLGILGMVLSTITMHMVCAGFACAEMFGWPFGGWRWRLALMLPVPGVLGAVWWSDMSVWVAVPTSVVSGFMLPLTYLGFLKLQSSEAYLGEDRPRGVRGALWSGCILLSIVIVTTFLVRYLISRGPGFWDTLCAAFAG